MAVARLSYCALLVVAALLVGCRSGVERDIVQRELRQQEDQIYALEDYLQEYQQLLCDARAENAALKRQMVQGQFREGAPNEAGETLPSPPPEGRTPTPSAQPPSEPAPAPEVPSLDLSTPEVPPLETSSAVEPERVADPAIEQASVEIEELEETAEPAEVEVVASPPTAVVLRGEVQVDAADADAESGPRVLLEVKPVDAEGQCVSYQGKLSVLVLDPAAPEKQRQLARWDFAAEDLVEAAGQAADGGYELPLQLPVESPTSRPLELWVRLQPEDGEKLLGRTTLDLGRSGRFATAEVPVEKKSSTHPSIHRAEAAVAELPAAMPLRPRLRILDAKVEQSGWQIAKPGEIVGRPAASNDAASEWKIATRPIPELEAAPFAASTSATVSRQSAASQRTPSASPAAPSWTPNRPVSDVAKQPPLDHIVPPPSPGWAPERFTR